MTRVASVIVALLMLTASLAPFTTAANEPPFAEAGLDQSVTKGATVLLDGSESWDADGRIDRYEWSITTPSGRTVTPDCPACARTRFAPAEIGTYTVSMTVTDDDGATTSDTLYVEVTPGEPPTVRLSGPIQPRATETATYSANIDAGTAQLDRVVWSIDGTEVADHSIDGVHAADTFTQTFPSSGTRTVSVTAYDEDGQRHTDTLDVSVQNAPSPPSNPTPPDQRTIADRFAPSITGDDLITGQSPLRGDYALNIDTTPERVEWLADGRTLGTGQTMATTWDAGDHSLYALVTYTDGSTDVAKFADGSTSVVADPKPTASFVSVDEYGTISGTASGTDDYENLQSVTVELNGEVVGTSRVDRRVDELSELQWRRTARFSHSDFEPGETYDLTVVVVDSRGQTTTLTRAITPVKKPEIVRSEFVNGPVDSYHERIDSNRYTAHHVTEIDLNGMDPGNMSFRHRAISDNASELREKRVTQTESGRMILHTYWAGKVPSEYEIEISVQSDTGHFKSVISAEMSSFKVTPSPPELRFEVINDGTTGYTPRNWGIVVDASASFDPDGTELDYIWGRGATPFKGDNTTAKFRSIKFATLTIRDEYGLTTSRRKEYLDHYVPSIQNVEVLSEGPYRSNGTVRVKITTEQYKFTKNSYNGVFDLGLTVTGSGGNVVQWKDIVVHEEGDENQMDDPHKYVGIVELDASKLASDTEKPRLRVYNLEHPQTNQEASIPDVSVLRLYEYQWTNVTVEDLEYTVERPTYDRVDVQSESERDEYLNDGYSITKKEEEGFKYTLEKHVKVRDAKYRTVTRSFGSEKVRSMFLYENPDWSPARTITTEKTKTVTESEWRDSKSGKGSFTGETRRVKTKPAEYDINKQYRYEYEVEKTGTRTITKTMEIPVKRTGTRTVMRCNGYLCYEDVETYTYWTTVERTYTKTVPYTYSVTRTNTYWAFEKLDRDHEFTGKKKRVKVDDAKYERQYRFEYSVERTEIVRKYEASKQEKVEDAKYEWQAERTTNDMLLAQSLISSDHWRVGSARPIFEWTLSKQTGTQTKRVGRLAPQNEVLRTHATVSADVSEKLVYVGEGRYKSVYVGEKILDRQYLGKVSRNEIRERVVESGNQSGREDNCSSKTHCVV